MNKIFKNALDADAIGFGVKIGDDAVPKHQLADGFYILEARRNTPVNQSPGFSPECHKLPGPGAGAPFEIFLYHAG